MARSILGRSGTFLVRPEKITLHLDAPPAGQIDAPGQVADVLYVGSETRYEVRLDAGTTLVVAEHNRDVGAVDAHARRGKHVVLSWPERHVVELREPSAIPADL